MSRQASSPVVGVRVSTNIRFPRCDVRDFYVSVPMKFVLSHVFDDSYELVVLLEDNTQIASAMASGSEPAEVSDALVAELSRHSSLSEIIHCQGSIRELARTLI